MYVRIVTRERSVKVLRNVQSRCQDKEFVVPSTLHKSGAMPKPRLFEWGTIYVAQPRQPCEYLVTNCIMLAHNLPYRHSDNPGSSNSLPSSLQQQIRDE